ncbi:14-3-3-like partial [Stylonychia lemnae]|uniref:14-3-3-like partial n=1 Tax=Stylonychia lemnae TaxID=5949 RepID=A0A078ALQ9_STYLE|nr:14-3-3-like partial [Stylonychia lemnae]
MATKHTREELLYLARLAEQCERYDEMVEYASDFAKAGSEELSLEERNILSVAFKNVVGTRRAAWRVLSSIEKKENNKGNASNVEKVKHYKTLIEDELTRVCQDILALLEQHLIPKCRQEEAQVFFQKMKGDYYRYIAEYAVAEKRNAAAQKALTSYQEAHEIAQKSLSTTHPVKLGLALNFSVFYYEIMQNPEKACKMARDAFDEAIADLDNVQDEYYKDATLIMQLLRDNLTLWTSELPEETAQ